MYMSKEERGNINSLKGCIYACTCILNFLRTNMSCKWDGNSFIFTNRIGAEGGATQI